MAKFYPECVNLIIDSNMQFYPKCGAKLPSTPPEVQQQVARPSAAQQPVYPTYIPPARLSALSSSSWQNWILLLVLLGVAALWIYPVSASAATDWFDKGNSFRDAGRYDEALAAYNKAIELDPNLVYAWNNKGNSLNDLGRYDEALAAYNKVLELDSNDEYAWTGKGDTLYFLRRDQEALDAFNKALSIDPSFKYAWSSKGTLLHDLGRYQEALDAYNSALSSDPNFENAWTGRGNALNSLGRYQEALDAYNKALSIDSNDEYAWNGEGTALYDLGRYQEALDAYNKALSINPNFAAAQNHKNILLNKIGTTPTPYPTSKSLPPSDSFNPMIIYGIILLLCIGGGGYYILHSRKSGSPPSQDIDIPAQNPSYPMYIPPVSSSPFAPTVTAAKGIPLDNLPPEVMDKLIKLSQNISRPVLVIDSHREIPTIIEKQSAHFHDLAVDIMIPEYNGQTEYKSYQIAAELKKVGFNGVGKYHRNNGDWTNTAHGDIRGEPPADNTYYALKDKHGNTNHYGKPDTWELWNISTDQKHSKYVEEETWKKWFKERQTDTIQSIPIPTPTPPPQIPVTPMTQSPATATTGGKLNTAVKWIAICCGGAILLVIVASIVASSVYGTPGYSSSSSSSSRSTLTSYTPQDRIIGVWSCDANNRERFRFNTDGTFVSSFMSEEQETRVYHGTWKRTSDNEYYVDSLGAGFWWKYDPTRNSISEMDQGRAYTTCSPYQGDVMAETYSQKTSTSSGTTSGSGQTTSGDCKPGSALCQARYINEHGWVGL